MRIGSLAGGFVGKTSGCCGGSLTGFGSGGCGWGGWPGRSGAGCLGIVSSCRVIIALHVVPAMGFVHDNAEHVGNVLHKTNAISRSTPLPSSPTSLQIRLPIIS